MRIICFIITYIPLGLFAQSEDLREDRFFFQQQAALYQDWLNNVGIGEVLTFREMEVKERELNLYLEFPYSDLDSIVTAWKQLKEDFEDGTPFTLEEQLFYKAEVLMEVGQHLLTVQLYNTYDLRYEPLFSRVIYFEDDQLQVETNDPKSKPRDISYSFQTDGKHTCSLEDFRRSYSREEVYDCIYEFAQQRFGQTDCEDRSPGVIPLENAVSLRFEVEDLCREVVPQMSRGGWCNFFRKIGVSDCNWTPRELLTFTFKYQETPNGFFLALIVDGKIGSGYYSNVSRGGYHSIETDYDDDMERYADRITQEIRDHLENCYR